MEDERAPQMRANHNMPLDILYHDELLLDATKPKPTADNIAQLLKARKVRNYVHGIAPVSVVSDKPATQNDVTTTNPASENDAAIHDAPLLSQELDVQARPIMPWETCSASIASQEELSFMDHLSVCGKNIPNKPGHKVSPTPPIIRGNVEGTHTFRFKQVADASSTVNLYVDDLAFLMAVASGSTTLRTIWESLKINRVSIWTPSRQYSGTLQDPRETSLTWLGDYTPRSEVFGTVNQQTGVCYISAAPPKDSGSGKWQKVGQGANNPLLCKLVVPDQSIVDITVSFVFNDDATPALGTTGYTNLTIGHLYYPCADSYLGSRKLEPMGMLAPT